MPQSSRSPSPSCDATSEISSRKREETIRTASQAAAAGGVTSMAALPNTDPVVDDVAGVEFVARRARAVKLVKIYTYGALTRRLEGTEMTELGLLSSYGAVGFTDGLKAVANAQVMRRALAYARTFDVVIAQQPQEPSLAGGAARAADPRAPRPRRAPGAVG